MTIGRPTFCFRRATPPGRLTTGGAAPVHTGAKAWATGLPTMAARDSTRTTRPGELTRQACF
eukprot:scaffold136513_cov42-Prasinocladus_malaysianus.AAC.1